MFDKIKKRDGTVVDFDSKKITQTITESGLATGELGEREARKLTLRTLTLAHELKLGDIPKTSEIKDLVERVLLDSPFYKTAKAYIIEGSKDENRKLSERSVKMTNCCTVCHSESDHLFRLYENSHFLICPNCIELLPNILDQKGLLKRIKKSLIFTPETRQAGTAILSYFAEVLEKKYPDLDVVVKIEQNGLQVTMIVETQSGEIEKIEKTLKEYGMVVTGKKPPESLLDNQLDVFALKQKLEIAKLEIKQKVELLRISEYNFDKLEDEMKFLREQFSKVIELHSNAQDFASKLIKKYKPNNDISEILMHIAESMDTGNLINSEISIKNSLEILQHKNPSVLAELYSFAKDSISGAAGQILVNWIWPMMNCLPK